MREGLGGARGIVRLARLPDVVEQAAAIKDLKGRRGQTAHSERQCLQRRQRIGSLLQDKDGDACETQLAGKEEPDRAAAGDYDFVEGLGIGHETLLCRSRSIGAFLE